MRSRRALLALVAVLALGVILAGGAVAQAGGSSFRVVRPVAAPDGCLERARGEVAIRPIGPVEVMTVSVKGLPENTKFALFVTQLPNDPFGISWYQGDIETDESGDGEGRFVGRFSERTFAIAPGRGKAPVVDEGGQFPDARRNPAFAPIHTYHLGVWFKSPRAAERAQCLDTVTPFDGDHRAGVKALSTRNFPDDRGPLREVGS